MKIVNLKSVITSLVGAWSRFYIVVVFVLVLAVLSFAEINFSQFEQPFHVWSFFILGAVSMLSVSLFNGLLRSAVSQVVLVAIVLSVIGIYSFRFFDSTLEWEMQQFAAIMVSVMLSLFFVLFFRPTTDKSFWTFAENNAREFISILIYAAVFYGGLAVAVYAVEELFSVAINDKVYGNLAMICFQLLAPLFFLTVITPKELYYRNSVKPHNFLRILGLYILFPVLALYLVILYVYLFKIVLSWQLPNGWVTSLVSVLALGGFLTLFLLFPLSKNKLVRLLNTYFPLLLLPLLILMSVGLWRRIDDYGLSVNRLYVLVFNLWLYGVSVYLFFTQSKSLRWLVISFSMVLFVVSVGPWSVFAITKRVVENDIKTILVDSKLLDNDKLINNTGNKLHIADTIAVQLSDKVAYYVRYYGIENWKKTFHDTRKIDNVSLINTYLGLNDIELVNRGKYVFANLTEPQSISVTDYNTALIHLSKKQNSAVLFSNKEYSVRINELKVEVNNLLSEQKDTIDLQPILAEFAVEKAADKVAQKVLIKQTQHTLMLIHSISAERISTNKFRLNELNISLYIK
ncbi:MAG: DUF4153 domain-containing protein [Paludibacter sp.]|nr:DUF4153 domain-containing protein [Paludibacter sp.]